MYPFTLYAAYNGIVAIIPCAPEPVILIAGLSKPITRASIAALHIKDAVFCSSSETSFPLLIANNCLANVVLGFSKPSWNNSRFTLYASLIKRISSISTVVT